MNANPHVTLADIAREAGTSASTASRALSGRGYVSEDARQRLRDAADRLGYVPNASARALKQRTSRVVGVAVSDLGNQFYANLAAGIEQTLREAEYQMVLVSDNSDRDQEVACARTFLAMRAAGMIITPADGAAAGLLARHGLPVVEVDRRLADVACDAVVIDNERGAKDGAVIAPNVVLSASVPVIDVTGSEPVEHRGYVPPRSVVLPGTRPKEYPAGRYDLPCALIVGTRNASTDLKTSLNDVLREFEIAT